MTSGVGFKDFYLDEALIGHDLLVPSIWVGESYARIFTPLSKCPGCDPCSEVATRVFLFIILPLVAVLSALLIPFGLLAKGIHLYADPPMIPPESVRRAPHQVIDPRAFGLGYGTIPVQADVTPPLMRPLTAAEEPPPLEVAAAEPVFREISRRLETINRSDIDSRELDRIRRDLQGNAAVGALLRVAPSDKESVSRTNPFIQAVEQYENLLLWIEALEHHHAFFGRAIRLDDRRWTAEGEHPVSDNGDCLFAASLFHSGLAESVLVADPLAERAATVEWMQENYNTNEQLQRYLINSLAEHYYAKTEKLQEELDGLRTMEAVGQVASGSTNSRQHDIRQELQIIEIAYIPSIMQAMGEAHSREIHFDQVRAILPEYFMEMSESGVHGGQAELYALSCRHQVCCKIHAKRPEARELDDVPHIIMNPDYETAERPARHFTHSRNHYNPYTPPASPRGSSDSDTSTSSD